MSAPHFFAPDVSGARVILTGEEARHAARVLRIRPGEEITIADGAGAVVRATATDVGAELIAEVVERWTDPAPVPAIHVFAAIPKAAKLDLVVQKLTELGVDVIQPFPAARSVSRWDAAKARAQTARLRAIAREASKQSRRSRLPEIRSPEALEALDIPSCALVLDEEASRRVRDVLPAEPPAAIGLFVGPEGGFEREEVLRLEKRGAAPVSLGELVLRAETAAIAAVAVVTARYGRLG